MIRVDGKKDIYVEAVADSISENGHRLSTFRLHYPRIIHCFDENTEILTQINDEIPKFRKFKAVKLLKCKVAEYNLNGEISFVYPISYVEQYSDNHKMVVFDKNKLSLSVTGDHRILTNKRTTNNEFKIDTIKSKKLLDDYGTIRIPQAGVLKTNQKLSNDEISLIMWFVADGHKPKSGNRVQFHFKKERKINTVCELLNSLNIEYTKFEYNDETVIKFDELWWVSDCYNDEAEKKLPDILFYMDQSGYKSFKMACLESDGNVKNNEYNTSSVELINQIQVIAHLHNDSLNIHGSYNNMFKQKFKVKNYISLRQDKDDFSMKKYDGVVYCVTVPSSYIIVRRNGIVHISGNSELMTHRSFSRNASSSRAIPVQTILEQVRNNPAMPVQFGKNKPGMQDDGEHDNKVVINGDMGSISYLDIEDAWKMAGMEASIIADAMSYAGYHKQVCNRLLEPFQYMNVIVSVTDIDNFWHLRLHEDADPTFVELAKCMYKAYNASRPDLIRENEYHLPFIEKIYPDLGMTKYFANGEEVALEDAIKISISLCCQVSYRKADFSIEKAIKIWDMLVSMNPVHASPLEHVAQPFSDDEYITRSIIQEKIVEAGLLGTDAMYCGNFRGWIQYRKTVKDENITHYKPAK